MKASQTALTRILTLSSAAVVAACVPSPDSTPTPAPTPVQTAPAPAPAPTPIATAPAPANWMDAPRTPGDWSIRTTDSRETVAIYGENASEGRFNLICNPSTRTIAIVRAGASDKPRQARILTETREKLVTMAPTTIGLPALSAQLSPSDPIFDAMALTKGRFAVETEGMSTLYLPAWAEVTRVIEDCR